MKWKSAYLESRILSADPVELVCILYEHAILAVEEARECVANKDIASRSRAISKAIAIIGELESSLNHEAGGKIAGNLSRLYQYMRDRLLTANRTQEARPLIEVGHLLETIREAWVAIRPEAASSPGSSWTFPTSASPDTQTGHTWNA